MKLELMIIGAVPESTLEQRFRFIMRMLEKWRYQELLTIALIQNFDIPVSVNHAENFAIAEQLCDTDKEKLTQTLEAAFKLQTIDEQKFLQ